MPTPTLNALCEVCLENLLVINQRHLLNVLIEYLAYYNKRRPHQGLDQQ